MTKNLFFSGLISLLVSIGVITVSHEWIDDKRTVKIEHISSSPSLNAVYTLDEDGNATPLDFNKTAEKVLDGVVHIKSTHLYNGNSRQFNAPNPFQDLFGDRFQEFFGPQFKFDQQAIPNDSPSRVGSGSGVIISKDGYIVTNNHVIAEADDIEVTIHDNRSFKARVIGTDPSTDLALLQIKANDLPTVPLVNSDNVRIGQWVLAVGNPMGLNSTVTAGIISAKGRNININKDKYAIENFIQTDAAINPGNSGGALVDLNGGLVGINTAISSPTGTFAGYGFAIPANIVNKVVQDLLEFGMVQRGVLGVMIRTVDGNFAKDKNLEIVKGVYVDSLMENSAAEKFGIKKGDVIVSVNGTAINTSPELQGIIAQHRPGQTVKIKVHRAGQFEEFDVVLNNSEGSTGLAIKDNREIIKILGADFSSVDKTVAEKLGIKGGVQVKKLYPGKLKKYTQIRDGFIITKIDGKSVSNVDEIVDLLSNKDGGVMIEGIYEDIPGVYYYAFGMNS